MALPRDQETLEKEIEVLRSELRDVSKRLQKLETVKAVAVGVAVIFGLGGGWGAKTLDAARDDLTQLTDSVTRVKRDVEAARSTLLGAEDSLVAGARSRLLSSGLDIVQLVNDAGELRLETRIDSTRVTVPRYGAQAETRVPDGWVLVGGGAEGTDARTIVASRPTGDGKGWFGWTQDHLEAVGGEHKTFSIAARVTLVRRGQKTR